MAVKRKARKKSSGALKRTKAARAPAPRKQSVAPRQKAVRGNNKTPILDHPYMGLSTAEKIILDLQYYGFKNVKVPVATPVLKLPRQKLPDDRIIVRKFMLLMQNKIVLLRKYFLPEVQNLMWRGIDKLKRSKSELAMLAEAAKPKKLVVVSYLAQDCIRLILTYGALFTLEDRLYDKEERDGYFKAEREANLKYRDHLWGRLRTEIAEQLPGDKKKSEKRAEMILVRTMRLI